VSGRVAYQWLTGATLAAALGGLACSPALNWREVRLEALSALLPCKPDRAVRTVQLADQALEMGMAGCEAQGALFAISHVRVANQEAVEPTLQAWRVSALQRTQLVAANAAAPGPSTLPDRSGKGSGAILETQGQQPDGSPVHAQLTWLVVGQDIFHAAVYAPYLTAEMTEPFFSELRAP